MFRQLFVYSLIPKMPKMKVKIDASPSSNQSGEIPKTKNAKIDKSSASIQFTSSRDYLKPLLMDTGAVDFADIRNKPAFVDKIMLIKIVLDVSSRILLIAPRHFGKSVNLTMMKRFFELSPNKEKSKTVRRS